MVMPRILERIKKLEKGSGGVVMAAPAVTGNSLVAIGYANNFTASAIPGLLNTQVATFVVSVNGGDPFEVAAVDNACEFDVVVPDGTQDGIAWTVRVYALDTVGNRSAAATVSPTTSLSRVERPSILSPAADSTVGATTAEIVLSPFACVGLQDTQEAVQYQALNAASEIVYDSGELTDSAAFASHVINIPADADVSGPYSLRARQKGAFLGWSAWSDDVPVTITRDYVVIIDDLLKTSFSTDGINFEPVVAEDILFDDVAAQNILEANGKIILWTGCNLRVSENGSDWEAVNLGHVSSSVKIVRHGTGFLAYSTVSQSDTYALSEDGINWGEAMNLGFPTSDFYQVNGLAFMESTQKYVALVRDASGSLYLYSTSVPGAWTQLFKKTSRSGNPSFLLPWGDNGVLCMAFQNYNTSYSSYATVERIYSTDGGLNFTTVKETSLTNLSHIYGTPSVSQKGTLAFVGRFRSSTDTTKDTYGRFFLPSISGIGVFTAIPSSLSAPLYVALPDSDDQYILSYSGSSYRFSSGGALLETISMPAWRFSGWPNLYIWSEALNRYIFSVSRATFLRDTFHPTLPLTVKVWDSAPTTSSACSFGPIGGEGYEKAVGYAYSGGTSASYPHVVYHTGNGRTSDRYNYPGNQTNVPSPDGRFRLSCKAFGKYFFAGKDMKVYAATTPYDMGDALSNQPYALGWASAAASQSLLFTGTRLVYLPRRANYKKIQYTTGLASPWVEGATLTYDFYNNNFSADTDGNGKIVISHENGVTVSADHGNTWSAWVAWSGLVGFNPMLLRYVGGVWLAYSGIKAALSNDGLNWTAFDLPVVSIVKPPAVAKDGRLIISAADGVMLVDISTLVVEYKRFFFGGSNPAVISTY